MKKCYPFLLAACIAPLFSFSQIWQSQNLNFTEPFLGADVSVVDENVVWMAAWQGDFSTSPWSFGFGAQHFSRTTDGGQTWQPGTFPSTGAGYFSNIHALDENVAWVAFVDFGEGNKVFKTIDGGQNWTAQDVGVDTWVNYVHFFDGTSGAVMGDPDADGFELFITNNGGTNWQRIDPATLPVPLPNEFGVSDTYAADNNDIWFATNYGRVFHSANRGYTWEVWEAPMDAFPGAIAARDGVCILEFGDFSDTVTFNHKSHFFRTADNGQTWEDITPANNNLVGEGLTYIPGTHTLFGAFRSNNVNGPFWTGISYDDGSTWAVIDEGTKIFKANFADANTGYGTEYKNDGSPSVIYRYTGSPLSGLFNRQPLQARMDVFPNPTAADARFLVELESPQDALVLLNDGQGRLVWRQVFSKEKRIEGKVDMTRLPLGAYYLTVSTPHGVSTEILIKN